MQRVAQTQNLKGKVTVQRGGEGEAVALSEGSVMQNGDVVRTAAQSSAEFCWQDGTRWKLNPNSRLLIKKSLFNSLKRDETSSFNLDEGQILVRVVKKLAPTSSFEVQTPSALILVRGAILSVAARNGVTDVNVFKGHAEISESAKTPSFSALASQNARVSKVGVQIGTAKSQSEFLASPTLLSPALEVQARTLKNGETWLKGHTEVGNHVSIEGESVPLLGNGTFVKRMNAKVPSGGWKIESTDCYGATAAVYKSPLSLATPSPQQMRVSLAPKAVVHDLPYE